ncbi:hypothetical protein B1A99_19935 [Cohnella sp. CIP 111063]|uniref:IucA/IucC family protein n=1 Tax=unclassified Cohnella TaxID=2636738 RepID=UPI000B8C2D19|nr:MULTISPECIES: IucA/IucC family protein [unclassified Cohnella]OXS56598.1 hypothetical protein B1A99_19935 [Cohnella sp. CIP 111063]PRX68783.1 siderophore synthetase component [Cohnella sp. SGD-V74]
MSEKGTDRSAQARQERAEAQAESRVMEDLANALLAEGMLDGHDRVILVSPAEWRELIRIDGALAAADRLFGPHAEAHVYRWRVNNGDGRATELVFPVFPAVVQPYRLAANAGVYELATGNEGEEALRKIGPLELMTRTLELHEGNQEVDPDSAKRLLDMIAQTLQQTAWTLENELTGDEMPGQDAPSSLLALERKAAFRDRPFHPVAKVKMGLAEADYRRYSPEFGRRISLRWMAVSRKHIAAGEGARDAEPARLLLAEEEEARVREEMEKRGLAADDYVPLPVHPWQMTGLAEHLREEMAAGVCVPLAAEAGVYHATSSLRSLMPESGEGLHVKLPLGLHSLGGLRYLSAIKLMNGGRAERLMRSALERDAELGRRLFLCDETAWWAYLPESRDLFAEAPRHLSAMLRQYPPELAADEGVRLVPMSALAVFGSSEGGHVFDEWLRWRGEAENEAAVVRLFGEAMLAFCAVALRLFRLGMMPEVHGQNSVLVVERGRVKGLLLRDHDALRVHVPWLSANGLADPEYQLRPNYPNSLYHDDPGKLLSFFQTLGIQVNGYAVLDSLSRYYGIPEKRLWLELRETLEQAVDSAGLTEEARRTASRHLFEAEAWPWKQLIRPLLKPRSRVAGSMPFGMGQAPNPLRVHAASLKL